MKNALILLIALVAVSSLPATAQTPADSVSNAKVGIVERILRALASENENVSFALYPAASYSDNVGLAVGVMPLIQVRTEGREEPSTFTTTLMVSTKKMFQAQCDADIFLRGQKNIVARAEFFFMPDDYYGIGNQKDKEALGQYDFYRCLLTADFMQEFQSGWEIGATIDVTHQSFDDEDMPDSDILFLSTQEGWNNGLGIALGYDSRDDVLSPRRGWLLKARTLGYSKFFGSDFEFGLLTIDARKYLPIGQESALALQAYWSGVTDGAPFYKMPTCGGTRLGRAIPHNLKYVDRTAWLLQGEYRFPLFWRLGATTFAGAGNVSHKAFAHETFDDAHLMAGAGLRLKVFPDKNLKLRLDVGFSSRGEHAVYMNIREAF